MYYHKVIEEHNAGEWYGKDAIYKVGYVVEKTRTPHKNKYYGDVVGHGATIDIPAAKVGVFTAGGVRIDNDPAQLEAFLNTPIKTQTTRYEHRVIVEHNAGEWYGKDYIFEVGKVLKKTKTPGKYKYYGDTLGHGVGFEIPAEKVGVFVVKRTTVKVNGKTTVTEEATPYKEVTDADVYRMMREVMWEQAAQK